MNIAKLILDYITVLIWPSIIIVIIIWFKNDITNLIERAKKIGLPGGISFEGFDSEIKDAKKIAKKLERAKIISKSKPKTTKQIIKTSDGRVVNVNDRLKELGLKPSPSGLAINYYEKIADIDPKLALAGIRIDLELMLKNLSNGFNVSINKNDSIFRMTKILRDGNAITDNQYHLIQKLIRISNAAVHGKDVTRPQANDVFKIMDILIKDFVSWLEWGFTNN